jgi:3-oxoacyl-[acyl-carrier-protein] synthase-3
MNHNLKLELVSVVSALPKHFELNSIEGLSLFGMEIKKIIKLTGIDKRHIAKEGLSVLDLSVSAVERLISINNIDKTKISLLIYVSFTFENRLPGDANKLASLIGLNPNTLVLDLSSACSGYLNGLRVVSSIIENMADDNFAILINGDVQSKFVSKKDRGTYPVFGDASTASLIKKGNSTFELEFLSMGEGSSDLNIKGFSSKSTTKQSDFDYFSTDNINSINNFHIYMNGISVYNFVVNDVSSLIKNYLLKYTPSFDYFIPHQANEFITKTLSKNLHLTDKLLISSNEFGNVGSSSIPLTIAKHIPNNSNKSYILLLSGFGAGLSANVGRIQTSVNFLSDIIYIGE